ncbi:hypothetical protein PR001_g12213 [Phytophthora rubi]|uniref:SET domain-containing protein n=1 Tax=Phytophthora rubi TaxID=129364 RepID=A0A6A3M3Z3_9STRA|nr:hypothetical protein PR001_g12213 [Phytophthora rubi]
MRSTPSVEPPATPLATARRPPSPTTSSPVLLETPSKAPLRPIAPRTNLGASARRFGRQARHHAAEPYARARPVTRQARTPVVNTTLEIPQRVRPAATHPGDVFVPASWPYGVVHLREQFNPLATIFPAVPHFGWCDCSSPCRVGSCRNSLMSLYCNINSCPFIGKCGNGLEEPAKVFLGRSTRTSVLGVVAAEAIGAGEVLGQYLGEMKHVRVSRADRPRNYGFRLMMKQRSKKPNRPARVAINAEHMGGLMRFVNHSCKPVAKFIELADGRRATVVVATTEGIHHGQEVTLDYGDDLWIHELAVVVHGRRGGKGMSVLLLSELRCRRGRRAWHERCARYHDADVGVMHDVRGDRRSRVVRLPTLQRAPEEQPAVQGRLSGKRANKNTKSKYQNFSNRLGGGDLTEFRDTIGAKRGLEEDKEMLEASYAKARRIRTVNATTALKTKLAGLENATNSMGGSFMETILLLREENERKAEDRRAEEEQRRRDDIAAR